MNRGRLLIALLVLTLIGTPGRAQFVKSVGIKIGTTFSNLTVSDITPVNIGGTAVVPAFPPYENVINPSIGVFADFLNLPVLNVQAEVSYSRGGGRFTYQIPYATVSNPDQVHGVATYTSEIATHYLILSLGVQPRASVGDFVVYADLRPTLSYLAGMSNLLWMTDEITKVQLGYSGGVGVDVSSAIGRSLFIEFSYQGDSRSFYNFGDGKLWNHSWKMSVGTSLWAP